ncbi:MAG: hypothetical protein WA510_25530 [Acidobacteriaceae bacterium]
MRKPGEFSLWQKANAATLISPHGHAGPTRQLFNNTPSDPEQAGRLPFCPIDAKRRYPGRSGWFTAVSDTAVGFRIVTRIGLVVPG